MPVPSVVRLRSFVRVPFQRRAAISRRGVFLRDGGQCQYCGNRAESIDHVVPRSRGGQHVWENVVAACRRCNTVEARPLPARDRACACGARPSAPRHLSWVTVRGRPGARAVGARTSPTPPSRPDRWPRPSCPDRRTPSAGLDGIELVRVRLPLRRALESAHGIETRPRRRAGAGGRPRRGRGMGGVQRARGADLHRRVHRRRLGGAARPPRARRARRRASTQVRGHPMAYGRRRGRADRPGAEA